MTDTSLLLINQIISEFEAVRRLILTGTVETDEHDNRSKRQITGGEAAKTCAYICERFGEKFKSL